MPEFAGQNNEGEYIYPPNINVSSFVSVKLSGTSNYPLWEAQMRCLMESQGLHGIIVEDNSNSPVADNVTNQRKSLVKGWILGSLSEEVLKRVIKYKDAKTLWKKLKASYGQQTLSTTGAEAPLNPTREGISSSSSSSSEFQMSQYAKEWQKAESLLRKHRHINAMDVINGNGDTMLHIATAAGKNYFLETLLNSLKDNEGINVVNSRGHTPLHIAAMYNNESAAKLLVKRCKSLLQTQDYESFIPLKVAYHRRQLRTFLYLWEATEDWDMILSQNFIDDDEDYSGYALFFDAIHSKQYDLALKIANIFKVSLMRDLRETRDDEVTRDYEGTRDYEVTRVNEVLMGMLFNFPPALDQWEASIYPSFNNVHQKIVYRSSNFLSYRRVQGIRAMRLIENTYYPCLLKVNVSIIIVLLSVLNPLYQLIHLLFLVTIIPPFLILYFILWKGLALVVPPIKRIEKKKKEYKEVIDTIQVLQDQIKSSCKSPEVQCELCMDCCRKHYEGPICEAIRVDAVNVVDLILKSAPHSFNYFKSEDKHNIIQLAVINRSHKVYNLISPELDSTPDGQTDPYRKLNDVYLNNLAHLAGVTPR